ISQSSLPAELFKDPETTIAPSGGMDATIYLISLQDATPHLDKKSVQVNASLNPTQSAIEALLGYTPPQGDSLTSPVSGTTLTGPSPDGWALVVNLGEPPVQGTGLRQALAQIVYTATEPPAPGENPQFDRVRILVNDKPIAVPLGDRTLEPNTSVSRG